MECFGKPPRRRNKYAENFCFNVENDREQSDDKIRVLESPRHLASFLKLFLNDEMQLFYDFLNRGLHTVAWLQCAHVCRSSTPLQYAKRKICHLRLCERGAPCCSDEAVAWEPTACQGRRSDPT